MTQLTLDAGRYVPRLVSFGIDGDRVTFDWGLRHELGTAAFWTDQARRSADAAALRDFELGSTLAEEVAACILGGYGVPAPVGLAAFEKLRREVNLNGPVAACDVEQSLREPLVVPGRPRPIRYRFPRQRALRIASALEMIAATEPPLEARALREWLRRLPGVGPKTASWIVRNVTGSSEITIIDIHIRRAGLAIGCFLPQWMLPRDYSKFESAFLLVAALGDVPAAHLDAFMWYELQRLGAAARFYGVDARRSGVPPAANRIAA